MASTMSINSSISSKSRAIAIPRRYKFQKILVISLESNCKSYLNRDLMLLPVLQSHSATGMRENYYSETLVMMLTVYFSLWTTD